MWCENSIFICSRLSESPQLMTNVTPINKSESSESCVEKFSSHLTESAHGNFLFVKLVLDQITRGNLVIKSSFKVLPVSLSEVFLLECNLRFSRSGHYYTNY